MTTQEIIDYYANLLILEYRGKPNAYATMQTLVTPIIMDQMPTQIQNAFDPSSAIGVQLDLIGKYCGVTRSSGNITLSDSDFRQLIKMAIITNSETADLDTIQTFLALYFPGEVFIADYTGMQINYVINSSIGSQNLVRVFVREGLLPRPTGVTLSITTYVADPTVYFGDRTYDADMFHATGFNNYDSTQTGKWLTYDNGIS